MKRFWIWLAVLACLVGLVVPAYAQSSGEQMHCEITVTESGGCNVRISAVIRLEEAVAEPVFPLPEGAVDATLNGTPVGILEQDIPLKSVTGGMAGAFPIVVTYSLPTVVTPGKGDKMLLTLPILSGFAYPVDSLEFTVRLPGAFSQKPDFFSGYHQSSIESLLNVTLSDTAISGVTTTPLKDHEALIMTMEVSEELFPRPAATARVLNLMDLAVLVAAVLALVYYYFAMRPKMPKRFLRSTPQDGISPGELAVWFTGGKPDFSLMVVTWAQLGYLRIQLEDSGRVLLHKRMGMGNERSAFENRYYKRLFGRRNMVDGTGYHYADICREVAKKAPPAKAVYSRETGNPLIFRILCLVAAALNGVSIGGALAAQSLFVQIITAAACALLAYGLQSGGICLPGRKKLPLYVGIGCGVVWLILGIWSGVWFTALLTMVFEMLSGILVAYGGKRTELGQQALGQILGLRKFMYSVSKKELQRLLKVNAGYFHELAPYALALDADRAFARRFAHLRLQECTYLIGPVSNQMNAAEWAAMLRNVVNILDAKATKMPLERITGR